MDFRAEHQAADRLLGVSPVTDYWRSLGERENTPEFEAVRHREFPEGASEAPEGISRRAMLGLMGASLSLSGLAACRRPVEKIVPYVQAPEDMLPGIPLRYATTMPFRGNALGLLVTSNDGRPTKVEGNELHPATQGASNAFAQNAIYELYDPDRARVVLQAGVEKTWKDFLTYWKTVHDEHAADGGAGLAIVAEPSTSPTEARLVDLLKKRFPQARVVTWAPLGNESRQAGLRAALGTDVEPVYQLDQARVILALDADFLMDDPDAIRMTRGYVAGRRDPAAMNRLYVAESTLSITGIAADHRLAIPSASIAAFTLQLATELGKQGVSVAGVSGGGVVFDAKWVSAVAKDLKANAGTSLILAGAQQPPEVHAAVAALNAALGNTGKTVTYASVGSATRSRVADLQMLTADLAAGKVKTLVVMGGNPAYDAPADLDFAGAAATATNRIRLGLFVDETSALADWHLPQAHFLESWGDARAIGGPLSVVQPLIEPLFGGHSAIELLAVLESGEDKPGYDLVRDTWKTVLGADFEKRWEKTLHDGVLPGSALAASAATNADMSSIAKLASLKAPQGGFELVFLPSSVVYDGSAANSAWMQELPEPVTKLTWDNAALMNKTDADGLGVRDGDVVTLALGDKSITAAALVLPGQAAGSVGIALGYGRKAAGRVGSGVGFDAYPLRTTKTLGFASGLTVTKAGGTHLLALTHEHWSQEGRDIVREKNVGDHAAAGGHGDAGEHGEGHGEHPPLVSPWPERTYEEGPQWAMTIDLNACTGCNACVVACQSENNIPSVGKDQVTRGREMHWIRIDRYFSGRPEAPESIIFQPVPCMHCENAPCEQVCPVAATVHGDSGLNEMVYNRCIGTRYCSNNCPYKVRRFNFYNFTKDTPETLQMAYNPDVTVRARGVMEKCTYCVQRLTRAQRDAKLANRTMQDGEARTACQQACPALAIEFGDVRDPKSRIAASKKSDRGYDLLAELNTKPRTSYLTRLRNPNPELSA
jgi:molybdopterin-containing oxidoreductase family iron-sulfur binding subunit